MHELESYGLYGLKSDQVILTDPDLWIICTIRECLTGSENIEPDTDGVSQKEPGRLERLWE